MFAEKLVPRIGGHDGTPLTENARDVHAQANVLDRSVELLDKRHGDEGWGVAKQASCHIHHTEARRLMCISLGHSVVVLHLNDFTQIKVQYIQWGWGSKRIIGRNR